MMPKGIGVFRARLPEILEDGENGLLLEVRETLADGHEEVRGLTGGRRVAGRGSRRMPRPIRAAGG